MTSLKFLYYRTGLLAVSGVFSSRIRFTTIFVVLLSIGVAGCTSNPGSATVLDTNPAASRHGADPAQAGWTLIWSDEFDAGIIDPDKWSHEIDCAGGGNHELQCYTDRAENAFVSDGHLHLVAREESYSGPRYSESDSRYDRNDTSKTQPFTSARVHTRNKLDVKYGRIDVRAKVAGGKGIWPAIWMLPTDAVYGEWPASGEIDIMEALNPGVGPDEVHGTLHYGLQWPQWENKVQGYHMDHNPAERFHVYSIEWEADQIRWYVDGEHYQTQTSAGWYNYIWLGQDKGFQVANPRAPFDQRFYLIMNVAVGGNWPGDPDRNWPRDRVMEIDYVRVYQCNSDDRTDEEDTGEGCATIDPAVQVNQDTGAPGTNVYTLYKNGPRSLAFETRAGPVTANMITGQSLASINSVNQHRTKPDGEHKGAWDIRFSGAGEVFLASKNQPAVPGYESALTLAGGRGWTNHGEVIFDLKVLSKSEQSEFFVKMASPAALEGSKQIELPPVGQWRQVAIKIADLYQQSVAAETPIDPGYLAYPFMLQHIGESAHVQVNNIRLKCAYNTEPEPWQTDKTCSLQPRKTPPKPLFVRVNGEQWSAWDCCGGAQYKGVTDDRRKQTVVEISYGEAASAAGLHAPRPIDFSNTSGGRLEFDFRQMQAPPEGSSWYVKIEGKVTAGQMLLTDGGPEPANSWQRYSIPLSGKMLDVDLSNITRVLIFPEWGKADGAVMRLANLEFVAP